MMRFVLGIPFALSLAGCASTMSGIGGSEGYACRAPQGAQCVPVSAVYTQGLAGSVSMQALPQAAASAPLTYGAAPLAQASQPSSNSGALRSNPRVLRIWIAPWEDADGDLHEASAVHLLVDAGRWLVEHLRPAARRGGYGVRPPAAGTPMPSASPVTDPATSTERLPALPGAASAPGELSEANP